MSDETQVNQTAIETILTRLVRPEGGVNCTNDAPNAPVFDQLQGHFLTMLVMAVWKLSREHGVKITLEDMKAYREEYEAGLAHFCVSGEHDGVEFRFVTQAAAERIAAHERGNAG